MSTPKANLETCRICNKQAVTDAFKPFCSKRCADIDLGRWLKGNYAIPGRDGEAGVIVDGENPDKDPGLE